MYKLANVRNPHSLSWDKNDLSASSSRDGSGGGGPRLISSLGMESTGKYFESAPAGVGMPFLLLGFEAFGIDSGPLWASGGEAHENAIADSWLCWSRLRPAGSPRSLCRMGLPTRRTRPRLRTTVGERVLRLANRARSIFYQRTMIGIVGVLQRCDF